MGRRRLILTLTVAAVLIAAVAVSLFLSLRPRRRTRDIVRAGELTASASKHMPNVVVVLIDTLRASYLDLYGYHRETAPFLAEIGSRSAVFDRAFSTSSWTAPSTASIFTGKYPWHHGIMLGFLWHERSVREARAAGEETLPLNRFAPGEETLPMRFKSLGYSTVGLASNINIGDEIGFADGFDRFVRRGGDSAASFVEDIEPWMDDLRAAQPFFAYIHLNDCHYPYGKRPAFYSDEEAVSRRDRALYLSEVRYTDAQVRRIYDLLTFRRDTLFVVVSDHGEEFMEHGGLQHPEKLYDELNRVLLMVHGPGQGVKAACHSEVNVSLIDLSPTIMDLVGTPIEDAIDGISLAPIIRAENSMRTELSERVLFAQRRGDGELWSAIDGSWKLIQHDGKAPELFNHTEDPGEQRNLASGEPDIVARLDGLLAAQKDESAWPDRHELDVTFDKALQDELESLGYIQ